MSAQDSTPSDRIAWALTGIAVLAAAPSMPATPKIAKELTAKAAANHACNLIGRAQLCPRTKDIVPRNDVPQGLKSCAKPAIAARPTSDSSGKSTWRAWLSGG